VTGDLMANIAACTRGVTRWREQVALRWSLEELEELIEAQFADSAALARRRILELPDGEHRAELEMDDSGLPGTPPLLLRVRVVIEGDSMLVDLSGLPPQVEAPINAGATGGAKSAVRVALKSLLAPERPVDHGLFEPIDIEIPSGTVLSAENGAPMGWWNQLIPPLIDLILRAIGGAAPEAVSAGHFGALNSLGFTGATEGGEPFLVYVPGPGGLGATSDADGFGPASSLMHGDNPRIADEIIEARYPLRILSRRLLRDAGGNGLHRGGPGVETIFETLQDDLVLSSMMNRTRTPAWGMGGGEGGSPPERYIIEPGSDKRSKLGQVSGVRVARGTRIVDISGGGGGWGTPAGDASSTEAGR
jgi:N-methylhydantoinase B